MSTTLSGCLSHAYPGYVHLEVTGKCNFNCKYCYNSGFRDNFEELSLDKYKSVINELVKLGAKTFVISGGEPFLRPDLIELLRFLKKKKVKVRILTNGSLITEEKIKIIKKENLVNEFRISLDSVSKKDVNRGKHFDEILRGIRLVKKYNFPLVINTILTSGTYNNLNELYSFVLELGANRWRIDVPFFYGEYKSNFKKLKISNLDDLFIQFKKLISRYLNEKPQLDLDIVYVFRSEMLNKGLMLSKCNEHPCNYMRNSFTIRPNGDVCFCPTLPLVFGNVKNESVKKIFYGNKRNEFMCLKLSDITACKDCKYLKICGAGCRADALFDSGDYKKKDVRFCKMMPLFEKHILPILPKKDRIDINEYL